MAFLLYLLWVHQPWTLTVYCDSWASTSVCPREEYGHREFASKEQALDWIQQNYIYTPGVLEHGGEVLGCTYSYLALDDRDSITRMRKEVRCDETVDAGGFYFSD